MIGSTCDTTQDHFPKGDTANYELGSPTLTISQENSLQTCLKASLIEASSQLRFFFPDDSILCHMTKTNPAQGQSQGQSSQSFHSLLLPSSGDL